MEDTRSRWEKAFLEAVEYDAWGQVEEAVEGYQRLQLAAEAESAENVLQLPKARLEAVGQLAACLKQRIQELQGGKDVKLGVASMRNLKPFMKNFIVKDVEFPFKDFNSNLPRQFSLQAVASYQEVPVVFQEEAPDMSDGNLRGPPTDVQRGDALLVIQLEKWGLKDVGTYVDPRVMISVRDDKGELLEAVQETPASKSHTPTHVCFGQTINIQTPLNKLPPTAAIFFEFTHFKQKKNKKSVKAYCFLEMDEIKPGNLALEIYKKPTIFNRKKQPSLYSVKPLFLHVNISKSVQH